MATVAPREMSTSTLTELAQRANEAATECEKASVSALQHAFDCGEALIAAKAKVAHGQWERWLRDHFLYSERHARRFMDLAAYRTRVSDSPSLREALADLSRLRLDGSLADPREEEAYSMLLSGVSAVAINQKLGLCKRRVKRIYYDRVVPELLAVDWRARAQAATVREMSLAKDVHIITADMQHRKVRGGMAAYLAQEVRGFQPGRFESARCVVLNGSPALLAMASGGKISLRAAEKIALLPIEEQAGAMEKIEHRDVSLVDDLRSRVSTLFDAKQGWQNSHGTSLACFADVARAADAGDLRTIVSCLESVAAWAASVATALGGSDAIHGRHTDGELPTAARGEV